MNRSWKQAEYAAIAQRLREGGAGLVCTICGRHPPDMEHLERTAIREVDEPMLVCWHCLDPIVMATWKVRHAFDEP